MAMAELAKARDTAAASAGAAVGAGDAAGGGGGRRTPGNTPAAAAGPGPAERVLSGPAGVWLESAVALLTASVTALLAAVGVPAPPPQQGAGAGGGGGATPGARAVGAAEDAISPAGGIARAVVCVYAVHRALHRCRCIKL